MRQFPGERARVSGLPANPESELAYRNFVAEVKRVAQKRLMNDLGYTFLEEPNGQTDEELKPLRAKNDEVMERWIADGKAEAFSNVFDVFANGVEGKKLLKFGDKKRILDVIEKFLKNKRYDLALWTDEALDADVPKPLKIVEAKNSEGDDSVDTVAA